MQNVTFSLYGVPWWVIPRKDFCWIGFAVRDDFGNFPLRALEIRTSFYLRFCWPPWYKFVLVYMFFSHQKASNSYDASVDIALNPTLWGHPCLTLGQISDKRGYCLPDQYRWHVSHQFGERGDYSLRFRAPSQLGRCIRSFKCVSHVRDSSVHVPYEGFFQSCFASFYRIF